MKTRLRDALLTPNKRISLNNGDVLRGIKATDPGFLGFGEAYFSYLHYQEIKAWKLHTKYTANLLCPLGKVKVRLYQECSPGILSPNYPQEIILSEESTNYQRLTLPPNIWYGFEGLHQPSSLIFCLLNGEHSPDEQQNATLESFPWKNHD